MQVYVRIQTDVSDEEGPDRDNKKFSKTREEGIQISSLLENGTVMLNLLSTLGTGEYLLGIWDRCVLNFQCEKGLYPSYLKRKQTNITILSLLRLKKVQVQ